MSDRLKKSNRPYVPRIDLAGTVQIERRRVPFSTFGSLASREAFIRRSKLNEMYEAAASTDSSEQKRLHDGYYAPILEQVRSMYAVDEQRDAIAGVPVTRFVPRAPRLNSPILLNLHGGGFRSGSGVFDVLESVPVASLSGCEVIAVDYAVGPGHRSPDAALDVLKVYGELLIQRAPESIGVFGGSAGGLLTAQMVAAATIQGVPRPGAVAMLCGAAAGYCGGDADYIAWPLSGLRPPIDYYTPAHPQVGDTPYFETANFSDPLVLPSSSDEVLEKFPPSLIITSTRDQAFSAAVYAHTQMVRLGVETDLHVWEGQPHCWFVLAPEIPESRQALDVLVKFFARRLSANGQLGRPQ